MHQLPTRARRILRVLYRALHPTRRSEVRVRVYLNTATTAMLTGYQPDALLALAYAYLMPIDRPTTDEVLLERVFATFNDHPDHDDDHAHTDAWYAKPLRSLSVGDVVALDDRCYACASVGWTPIPAPPS
ncbi:hypothetical protein OIE68_00360 [Nocardia vinacea]|uniref:hypothetical protein n=1 Tax=Nocardia vinacea TaxID=96468 RepID=UPI002E10A04D|nr:hypothetical protein OIE68_00360 [Nocardia vinacea]